MNDISQDKELCADLWLQTGQRPLPCCCICGREFGENAQRCAQDFIHCVVCRYDYDRYWESKFRRQDIPRLITQLRKLIYEERQDTSQEWRRIRLGLEKLETDIVCFQEHYRLGKESQEQNQQADTS